MTNERLQAVVIGCGRIGSTFTDDAGRVGTHSHAQAYREDGRTVLAGVADTDPARLSQAMRKWGVIGRSDGVALCRELRPEIVSICTPDRTHAAIARALLESAPPRLLFVEKPLAATSAEAAALVGLARARGALLAVNHTRRFSGAFRALAEELGAGLHGRPILARIMYGKGLRHNGVHAVDLFRLWLGEPTTVRGEPAAWGPDGDETYSATLAFASGARGLLEAFDERVATVFEGELLAEQTRWRFWSGGDEWEFGSVNVSAAYAGYLAYVPTGRERSDERFIHPLGRCLTEAVSNIVGALEGHDRLRCDGDDAVAALRIVEDIERSGPRSA